MPEQLLRLVAAAFVGGVGAGAAAQAEEEAKRKRIEQEELDQLADEQLARLQPPAPPVVDSPPPSQTSGPLSEDDLSAIFDEAAAELREESQEQPDTPPPGEPGPRPAPTSGPDGAPSTADAAMLRDLINGGSLVLFSDSDWAQRMGLPTIHQMGDVGTVEHMGFGVFKVSSADVEATWSAGGAMSQTPDGLAYTVVSVNRGRMPYPKARTIEALNAIAGAADAPPLKTGSQLLDEKITSDAQKNGAADKHAAALIAEAAKLGVKGADEALTGLAKLFGKPGQLNSFPGGFDEDTYRQAKPHFEAALKNFQDAGKTLKDLFKLLIQQFGDGIKEYAVRFAADARLTANLGAEQTPTQAMAAGVVDLLRTGRAFDWRELFELADRSFGGTQADGKYTPKDAYDAMEAGVNQYILANGGAFSPTVGRNQAMLAVAALQNLTAKLPTQTKRTKEHDAYQQFSTVPPFAFVANWVAGVGPGDTMLESSAGIGGLAVFSKLAGARLVLNELSSRRAAILQEVFPGTKVWQENAEQIHNILPDEIRPTKAVINPPFSASAATGRKSTSVGAEHLEQALLRLVNNGRLVAIVGDGMAMDKPAFREWWKKMQAKYDVRAVVPVDGAGYAKYGTTFDNVLVVIDKRKAPADRQPITTKADTYDQLIGILAGVRDDQPVPVSVLDGSEFQPDADRGTPGAPAAQPESADRARQAAGGGAPGVDAGKPAGRPGVGGSGRAGAGTGRDVASGRPGGDAGVGIGAGAGANAGSGGAGDAPAGGGSGAAASGPGRAGLRALFQRKGPDHTPEQTAALAKAGVSGPRSIGEKVRAYFGAAIQMVSDRNHLANVARQGVLDQFHGIRQAVRREIGNLPVEQDPYIAARLANGGTSSVMRALMLHGQARWTNNSQHLEKIPGTKGLLDILAPLGDDLNDWFGWMVGNRAERMLKEGREKNLTKTDIAALKALATPEKLRRFQAAAIEYAAFKRSVLDVAQAAGLIDPDSRKVWDHADYIPFYREIDDKAVFSATGKKGLSGQSSGIRRLKGGTTALNDPMENLLMNFSRLIDASLKNNAILKTVRALEQVNGQDTIKKIGYDFRPAIIPREQIRQALVDAGTPPDVLDAMPEEVFDGMAKVWQIQQPTDPDVIRVMVGGKPKFYRVNDPMLLRALTSFVPFDFPGLAIMRNAKTLLTKMVTATPEFMVRNFIRDSVAAHAIARTGFNPAESVNGIARSFNESGGFESMLFAGASFQTGQYSATDPESTALAARRALRRKGIKGWDSVLDTPAKMWDVYRHAGESIENANREAVYEGARRAGMSVTNAVYQAKDLMDFSLRGSWPAYQLLADVLPFLNARVQGMYRLARSDPKRMLRVGGMLMVASLLLAAMNDGEDWYEELPDWDKDTYWHFMLGGQHYRVPKPFEIGVIFATIPERIWRSIKGLDSGSKTLSRTWANIRDQLAFDPVPQLIRPGLNVWANNDVFRDAPIENQSDEGKLPAARFDARTSATTRVLAQSAEPLVNATGLSPKRMEYLVGGYFGTAGLYALGASDMLVRALEGGPERPELRIDDIPLVRAFVRADPARGTVFESDLWKMRSEIDAIKRTIQAQAKSGDLAGAKTRIDENKAKLEAAGQVLGASNAISTINKERDRIYADTKLTPAEKRVKLDELQRKRNEIARKAVQNQKVKEAF